MWPINVGDRVRTLMGQAGIVIEMNTNEPEHEQMPLVELDSGSKKLFWPDELEIDILAEWGKTRRKLNRE